jgi:OmpA-OmpF porin, OOP family
MFHSLSRALCLLFRGFYLRFLFLGFIGFISIAVLYAQTAHAQVGVTLDAKGAKDHPEIPRIEGSLLVDFKHDKFDESEVPLSRVKKDRLSFEKTVKFEGERTRLLYVLPDTIGTLEVERNYQTVLAKRGYQLVFSCQDKSCGTEDSGSYFFEAFYSKNARILKGQFGEKVWFGYPLTASRFAVFKKDAPTKDSGYAIVATGYHGSNYWRDDFKVKGKNALFFEMIEAKTMDNSMVTVAAAEMSRDISASGKAVLYGILFDTNKTDIKPESKPQLDEMAKLLKQDPKLVVYIAGHTDNQGTLAYNLDLSQRRADAVVKALAGEYKINPKQMTAKGLANLAPVSSNDAETGRAKNRRVELVKQ